MKPQRTSGRLNERVRKKVGKEGRTEQTKEAMKKVKKEVTPVAGNRRRRTLLKVPKGSETTLAINTIFFIISFTPKGVKTFALDYRVVIQVEGHLFRFIHALFHSRQHPDLVNIKTQGLVSPNKRKT